MLLEACLAPRIAPIGGHRPRQTSSIASRTLRPEPLWYRARVTHPNESAYRLDAALRERVATNLEGFERRSHSHREGRGLTAAAVAFVLVADTQGRACFILTRRASKLKDHPGQWALPGGRMDSGESHSQTALRECLEEVGLALGTDSVLGLLDDYPTRSGYVITPVVVWGGLRCELTPNEEEVAAIYRVPLEDLDLPGVPRLSEIPESDRPVISIPLLGTHIHAPTAAILFQLREVAVHGRPTRVDHYEQPLFAWK
jgi:8-oxo-dGTP pyrophosphatase MutT (NUDIX family)